MSDPTSVPATAKVHIDRLETMLASTRGELDDAARVELAAIYANFDQRLTAAEKDMDRVLARLGVE